MGLHVPAPRPSAVSQASPRKRGLSRCYTCHRTPELRILRGDTGSAVRDGVGDRVGEALRHFRARLKLYANPEA